MAYVANSTSSVLKDLIQKSQMKRKGPPMHFQLTTVRNILDEKNPMIERWTFGERNTQKNNTILLVGETGTGKTTLINTMVNYTLGVEFKDKLWFEITEEEGGNDQTESQTSKVTVYEVFAQDGPSLTIIDTPGYGDTRGLEKDMLIAENLLQLFRSENGIHEITAVALVVMESQSRITGGQAYIFDSVLSLFGNDIENNIVFLVTHASTGRVPKNLLSVITKAQIPSAKNENGQPVYFLFDNCQSVTFNDLDEYESSEAQWIIGMKNMKKFMAYLDNMRGRSLRMTEGVLKDRKQLVASINCIQEKIRLIEYSQKLLLQTEEAVAVNAQEMEKGKNFTYEVDEPYKEKVPTEKSEKATCCSVCEENCHYPGCWWVRDLSWCSAMKSYNCTVCTEKCHYTKHVKEAQIYKLFTRKVTKTYEDLKAMYTTASETHEKNLDIRRGLTTQLEKEEADKSRLVDQAYQCIMQLENIALKSKSLSTLEHLDFLIEKMMETGSTDRVQKLEAIKRKCEEENKKGASMFRSAMNYVGQ